MKRAIPESELRFAAKTGFLSHDLWQTFFFQGKSQSWAHDSWSNLISRGFFKKHPSYRSPNVIVPNADSEGVRRICPGGIVLPPYLSQLHHDEVLYKGLLLLLRSKLVESFITEPEVRRAESTGIPRGSESHKLPDLILGLKGGSRIAMEMELTQKSAKRYRHLLNGYRIRRNIDSIIFAVPSRTILDCVARAAEQVLFPLDTIPIGFINVDDWCTNPSLGALSFPKSTTTLKALVA